MDKPDSRPRKRVVQLLAILFALVAAYLSYELLRKHMTGATNVAWFEAACTASGDGADSCDAALASKWAFWPPVRESDPPDKGRLPVAFLGLIYYVALLFWFLGIGRPDYERRWCMWVPTIMMVPGLAASAWFMIIMVSGMSELCPLCAVTHVLNLGLAVCLVLMWPGKPPVDTGAQAHGGKLRTVAEKEKVAQPVFLARHPSDQLVIMTLVAMILAVTGVDQMRQKQMLEKKAGMYDRCIAAVKRFKGDVKRLLKNWDSQEAVNLEITDADPVIQPPPGPSLFCVVFSDFECGSCKRIGAILKEQVRPMFDGHFKIVYKHFPLDPACNPRVTEEAAHHNSCLAARLAHAAFLQGGDEGFWKAYDEIYSRQRPKVLLAGLDPTEVGESLGLDVQRLLADMESPETYQHIKDGIALAHKLGLGSTPVVFVNGKKVDGFAVTELEFWDRLANYYWATIGKERPEHTKTDIEATQAGL